MLSRSDRKSTRSSVISAWNAPDAAMRAYPLREPRRSCTAFTDGVKKSSDGLSEVKRHPLPVWAAVKMRSGMRAADADQRLAGIDLVCGPLRIVDRAGQHLYRATAADARSAA